MLDSYWIPAATAGNLTGADVSQATRKPSLSNAVDEKTPIGNADDINYFNTTGVKHRYGSTSVSNSKTTDFSGGPGSPVDADTESLEDLTSSVALLNIKDVGDGSSRSPSITIWTKFAHTFSLKKRFCFIKLLAGLSRSYPVLDGVLNRAGEPIDISRLQTMFQHSGLTLFFGRCNLQHKVDVLVLMVRERRANCYIVHELEGVGDHYHVCDYHYVYKNQPDHFVPVSDVDRKFYWIAKPEYPDRLFLYNGAIAVSVIVAMGTVSQLVLGYLFSRITLAMSRCRIRDKGHVLALVGCERVAATSCMS
jgi:hypothetical protein